jgi:alanine or glycine:cation symporter, AGCS family
MRAVYAADIGIGYDAIVQSETRIEQPRLQSLISIYALLTDIFICTMTTLLFAITGAWHKLTHIPSSDIITHILGDYISNADIFITVLLFIAGFTTVVAYFGAGMKTSTFLNKKYGKWVYIIYAIFTFIYFSYYSSETIVPIMFLIAGLLVIINISAVIKLIKEIKFY